MNNISNESDKSLLQKRVTRSFQRASAGKSDVLSSKDLESESCRSKVMKVTEEDVFSQPGFEN